MDFLGGVKKLPKKVGVGLNRDNGRYLRRKTAVSRTNRAR